MTVAYFVGILLLSIVVSNIALSMTIDLMDNIRETSKGMTDGREDLERVLQNLLDQARERNAVASVNSSGVTQGRFVSTSAKSKCAHPNKAVGSSGRTLKKAKSLDFSKVKISANTTMTTSLHKFIAGTPQMITKEDLKVCEKYSNIDLQEFYSNHNRMLKDLNWEMKLTQMVMDSDAYQGKDVQHKRFAAGEVLFRQFEPATRMYLLMRGTLRVTRRTHSELETILNSIPHLEESPHCSFKTQQLGANMETSGGNKTHGDHIPKRSDKHNYKSGCGKVHSIKSRREGREVAFVGSINLIGSAALCPDNRYPYKCTASNDCDVIVIDQIDVVDKMDEDLCGYILRMTFKSDKQIQRAFAAEHLRFIAQKSRMTDSSAGSKSDDSGDDRSKSGGRLSSDVSAHGDEDMHRHTINAIYPHDADLSPGMTSVKHGLSSPFGSSFSSSIYLTEDKAFKNSSLLPSSDADVPAVPSEGIRTRRRAHRSH